MKDAKRGGEESRKAAKGLLAIRAMSAILIPFLLTTTFFPTACTSREALEKAERIHQRELDSVREVHVQDSLGRARFSEQLLRMKQMLRDSLELRSSDCMRFSVMFGWPTEAGPCYSISPCKDGNNYVLYLNAFKWRNHDDFERVATVKPITEAEFMWFSTFLDSIQFDEVSPHAAPHDSLDIQVLDGDRFIVERRKGEQYHGIMRYTPPELFVYDLLAGASDLAGLPNSFGQNYLETKKYWIDYWKRRQPDGDSSRGR
jgi:hypothetical protein